LFQQRNKQQTNLIIRNVTRQQEMLVDEKYIRRTNVAMRERRHARMQMTQRTRDVERNGAHSPPPHARHARRPDQRRQIAAFAHLPSLSSGNGLFVVVRLL
jgi:hypothetical protein